ncbi:MAG: FAD-dependent oxidoreductase [Victivallaceae bacterium]|nr:FAD-dependent oxidoreductase [Victivallaceae bacterium]
MRKIVLFGLFAICCACRAFENVDVVVIGGTQAGIEAAVGAKSKGARVVLFEARHALMCDTAGKLILPARDGKLVEPLAVRKAADRRLLDEKIDFRTWTYVKDIVRTADGAVAGVTTVSRSGERFIPAKAVVDATERAYAAKAAGSVFKPFPARKYEATRYVVSCEKPKADGLVAEKIASTGVHEINDGYHHSSPRSREAFLWKCTFSVPMKDGSPWSFAEMEQIAREKTWTKSQMESAESCSLDAPDKLEKDAPGVFTAGPLGKLHPYLAGREAADYARAATGGEPVPSPEAPLSEGFDCAVVGLGTGGAPALVAASRSSMKSIGFEYSYRLGGVSTEGQIGKYCFGNLVGFTAELDRALAESNGLVHTQSKENFLRSTCHRQGATIMLGSFVYGVEKENGRIVALKVMLAEGYPVRVPVRMVIDATGNCDIAAAAGEETEFITADELSLQGAGFMRKKLGFSYLNLDWTFVNDCDAEDLWYLSLRGRLSYQENAGFWDQSQMIDTRERRRLFGLFRVTPQDVLLERSYPDIVCITRSNFDTHGQTVDPQLFIQTTGSRPLTVNLPYRALLPRKTDNLIVIGLGLSASRDAMPILRMIGDVQNQGFVAGKACEHALNENKPLKDIDIKCLQRDLVRKGIVPEWVLTARDTLPVPDEKMAEAVASLGHGYQGLAEVFSDPARSLPLVEKAYRSSAEGAEKIARAHVLGMLGSNVGESTLVSALAGATWDKGWQYRGMDQFGRPVSQIDSYVIALAKSKSHAGFDAVSRLAKELRGESEYSHYRAVAMYFEAVEDRRAVPILAALLALPGVGGHAFSLESNGIPLIREYDVYRYRSPNAATYQGAASESDFERMRCLKELTIARALYNLGDADGVARKTLEAYANDPRRAYAAHARLVLDRAKPAR